MEILCCYGYLIEGVDGLVFVDDLAVPADPERIVDYEGDEQVLVDRYSGAGEGPRIEIVSVVMVIFFGG
jgi:hypothetical protein